MQPGPAAVPTAHDGVIFLGAALASLLALRSRLSESLALGEGAKHTNTSACSITSISTAKFRAFSMHIHSGHSKASSEENFFHTEAAGQHRTHNEYALMSWGL